MREEEDEDEEREGERERPKPVSGCVKYNFNWSIIKKSVSFINSQTQQM